MAGGAAGPGPGHGPGRRKRAASILVEPENSVTDSSSSGDFRFDEVYGFR